MTNDLLNLAGRRILVTGGSSGIGRISAGLFSRLGACCVLIARDEARLDEALSELEGTDHSRYIYDLTASDGIPSLVQEIARDCGPLWGLFHAAGAANVIPVSVVKEASIEAVMAGSFRAALLLARGFCRAGVRDESGGSIVYMSSVAAQLGQPGMSVYSASKAAIDGAVRSLALELAPKGIRVNSIRAGAVKTEMWDALVRTMSEDSLREHERKYLMGIGTGLDVANAAAFLLSDAARWITGTTLVVDGGYCCH